ncbi:MAG TPA: ABC transporter substrate-binding protein [Acidobacteriota bacterium]
MSRLVPSRRCLRFLFLLPLLAGAAEKQVLRVACFDFPRSFNPVYATGETAQAVANKIYQSLFYFDCQGNVRPELVERFSGGDTALEISLTLKQGAHFADGSALGSRDVVATVALLKNPLYEYPYLSDLDFLEKIEATGPLSLRLRLKENFAPWKNYLTFKILCAAEIESLDPKKFRSCVPRGSGPYRLAAVKEPWGFDLEKNPFWPGRRRFAAIRYSVLAEPRQAPLKLLNAEVDAVEIQGDDARTYAQVKRWQESFQLLQYRKFGYTYLVFNLKNPGLDKNLRRVFYNRLLAGRFLDDFLQGAGERVFSPFMLFGKEKDARPLPAVAVSGRRTFKVLANSESELRKQLVLFMCEEMKGSGIELEPVFVEYQTFLKYLKQGNFDLAVSAFLLDMDWNMKDILASSGYFNYAGFSDARMDAVLGEGMHEMDPNKRRKIYERAHDLWLESLPLLPLFSLNYYMGVSRKIRVPDDHFTVIGSSGDIFYNIQDW